MVTEFEYKLCDSEILTAKNDKRKRKMHHTRLFLKRITLVNKALINYTFHLKS